MSRIANRPAPNLGEHGYTVIARDTAPDTPIRSHPQHDRICHEGTWSMEASQGTSASVATVGAPDLPAVGVRQVRIENVRAEPLDVSLEPWGDYVSLAPGTACDVVAHGEQEPAGPQGWLNVVAGDKEITVWAEGGIAGLSVFRAGKLVWKAIHSWSKKFEE